MSAECAAHLHCERCGRAVARLVVAEVLYEGGFSELGLCGVCLDYFDRTPTAPPAHRVGERVA